MGTYLNPGNQGFSRIANSDYVDKTGLIGLLNRTIGTESNLERETAFTGKERKL